MKKSIKKRILDTMAAICLVFNVDWDTDFADDDYVLAHKEDKNGLLF